MLSKVTVKMVDPPSGWKYGFPMPYDEEKDGPLEDFLRSKGYPEKDIDFACSYVRVWEEEVDA
jgi:hypothetical protein